MKVIHSHLIKVLFVGGDSVKVGAPTVEGATVTATVNKQGRGKNYCFHLQTS